MMCPDVAPDCRLRISTISVLAPVGIGKAISARQRTQGDLIKTYRYRVDGQIADDSKNGF
jgi:hypothetical protein